MNHDGVCDDDGVGDDDADDDINENYKEKWHYTKATF